MVTRAMLQILFVLFSVILVDCRHRVDIGQLRLTYHPPYRNPHRLADVISQQRPFIITLVFT